MSARPITRSRTASITASAAPAAPGAVPHLTEGMPARSITRGGLTDITNRSDAARRQRPAAPDVKRAVGAAKKPHAASASIKPTMRTAAVPAAATRGPTIRRLASASSSTVGTVPQATSTTVHRAHSAQVKNSRATIAPKSKTSTVSATPKATSVSATTSRTCTTATATASTTANRQRSVKRVASRTVLNSHQKKPRLGATSSVSATVPAPVVAPSQPVVSQTPKDEGWEDLDTQDQYDPIMVVEYADDVFAYLKELEVKTMPGDSLLKAQPEIKVHHRSTLVDWMIGIHAKLGFVPETLFLAINLLDRFLSTGPVKLSDFQLLGLSCLVLAAKYEQLDGSLPTMEEFSIFGGDLFHEEELRVCERKVLAKLNFNLSYPNPMNFLRRISKADDYDIQTRTLAKYFVEIGLVDWRLLAHPPSVLAAAAIWLSRLVLDRGPWGPTLVHYSTYTENELLATAEIMLDYVLRQPYRGEGQPAMGLHTKLFKKYSHKRFFSVAHYVREWAAASFSDCVIVSRAEPEADDPIAVDLFGERGHPRPDTMSLMRIFNLISLGSPGTDDDDGLAPMPFSPKRAASPCALTSS